MENKFEQNCLGHGDNGPSSPLLQKPKEIKNSVGLHSSLEDIHHPRHFRSNSGDETGTTNFTFKKSSTPTRFTETVLSPCSRRQTGNGSSGSSALDLVRISPSCSGTPRTPVDNDNRSLYKYIEEEKRATLLRKVAMGFVYGALKKSTGRLALYEEQLQFKSVECAARLILHGLLLNAWRKDRIELTRLVQDNAQLKISVENLGIQLRVLRHLQCQEKDRANEKVGEIRILKNQVNAAQKSLKNVESDMSSVEEELRFTREDNEKLVEQKAFTQKELKQLLEEKASMTDAVDLERKRVTRAEEECRMTKSEYADLRKQVKDLSNQSFQWKDRARNLESQGNQIGEDLELCETSLRVVETNFNLVLAELEQFKTKKETLEEAYGQSLALLKAEKDKTKTLKVKFETATGTLVSQIGKLITLEEAVLKLRAENKKTEKEYYWHKLKNVRNRRAWVNAVNVVSSPGKLIQYLLFGNPSHA